MFSIGTCLKHTHTHIYIIRKMKITRKKNQFEILKNYHSLHTHTLSLFENCTSNLIIFPRIKITSSIQKKSKKKKIFEKHFREIFISHITLDNIRFFSSYVMTMMMMMVMVTNEKKTWPSLWIYFFSNSHLWFMWQLLI